MRISFRQLYLAVLLVYPGHAASWKPLVNLAPSAPMTMILLTDGSVMVQAADRQNWMHLRPDAQGNYQNGLWNTCQGNPTATCLLAPMSTPRLYFASQMLTSGKLWIMGGEYSGTGLPLNWSSTGEIFDPAANTWSTVTPYPNQANCPVVRQFGGTLTSGSTTVSGLSSTAGFFAGWSITGNGIPANTTILGTLSNTQIVISKAATASGSEVLQFGARTTTGNTTTGSTVLTGIQNVVSVQPGWYVSGPGIPSNTTVTNIDTTSQIEISRPATATATGVSLNIQYAVSPSACVGDDPSMLLPGGSILAGSIVGPATYLYNVTSGTWAFASNRLLEQSSSEEGWTKLADGSILSYDIRGSLNAGVGQAEIFSLNPDNPGWTNASGGNLPLLTSSALGDELGPSIRLQDGRVLVIGANGLTALYTPSSATWAPGPQVQGTTLGGLPCVFGADDAAAAILPNGDVLFAADEGVGICSSGNTTSGSPVVTGIPYTKGLNGYAVTGPGIPSNTTVLSVDSASQIHLSQNATATASGASLQFVSVYSPPTQLFVFSPASNNASHVDTIAPVSPAIPDTVLNTQPSYVTRMLALPTGQILFSDGSTQLWIYTGDGSPSPALLPTITQVSGSNNGVYTLTGTQLNGQSAGSSYGDDAESDENYPIVSLTSASGNVYYARTFNWSDVGVATGSTVETVNFTLDPTMPTGTYSLTVSGAGLTSAPTTFNLPGPSSTTLQAFLSPSVFGQYAAFQATVTPSSAGGLVTFYDGTTVLGTAPITTFHCVQCVHRPYASFSTPALSAGTHSVWATYNGDAADNPSASGSVVYTVNATPGSGFSSSGPFSAGTQPISLAVGYLNGDGVPDLAVASYNSSSVSVLLGLGQSPAGGFNQASGNPYPVGSSGPYSVAIADFNRDGTNDIAVASTAGSVSVLLAANPGYTQAAGSPYTLPGISTAVAVGDFNGDGIPDLAVTNDGSNLVAVLLGNSSGGFTASAGSPFGVGGRPFSLVVGDFNGDGKADLAVANYGDGTVTILKGDGAGGFSPMSGSPYQVGTSPRSIAAGDFNGDGKLDLATANSGSNNVTVLLGNGSGGFTATANPFPAGNAPYSIAVGDFNGDGNLDLATANNGSGNVTVLLGNGSAGFLPAPGSPFTVGSGPTSLAVGDFNSDGRPDLAVANSLSGNVSVLLATPPKLSVALSHTGDFGQGQSGATYSVTVTNKGTLAASGDLTLSETMPTGLNLVSMRGDGWNCPANGTACTRNDAVPAGGSFPPLTVTVNVANPAPASVINQVSLLENGSSLATASDPTNILVYSPCDVTYAGSVGIVDVQRLINEALGLAAPANDLNGDGVVTLIDLQIVMNAVLKLGCSG